MTIQPIIADVGTGWILGCTIVSCLIGIGAFAVSVVAMLRTNNIAVSPQPLAIKVMEELQDQFASKTEFINFRTETHKETAELREIIRVELPEMERRLGAAGDARIRRVHQRIEPLVSGVAALCAKQGITFSPGRADD
jgi:hypothetical protein